MKIRIILIGILALASIFSCNRKKKEEVDFDRAALLRNLSKNIIIPQFQSASAFADSLDHRAQLVCANPTSAGIDSLQEWLKITWKAWQTIEVYGFGPAESTPYKMNVNVFPTDSVQILSNINAGGNVDLSLVSNLDAKGLPAIDYLLNAKSDSEILNLFSNDVNANSRKTYLKKLTNEVKSIISDVLVQWETSYQSTFNNNTGLDIGSSTGLLVNYLSMETETVRREKIGTPIGYIGFLNGGLRYPEKVEAVYGGYSKELIIENLTALKNLYKGGSGTGFDDYLDAIGADFNGNPLSSEISSQFDKAINAVNAIPGDLKTACTNNFTEVDYAFLQCKILAVRIKVDMSSQLGVSINYTDNDGD